MKNALKNLKAELVTLNKDAQVQIKGGTGETPPTTTAVVIEDISGF